MSARGLIRRLLRPSGSAGRGARMVRRLLQRAGDVACCPLRRAWPAPAALAGFILLGLGLGGGLFLVAGRQQQEFPHERHARLFPFCTGCHEGIETGDSASFYPPPQLCERCHDGTDLARVQWSVPSRVVSNLDFSHQAHELGVESNGMAALECERCHVPEGAPRMAVDRTLPRNCFSCHIHEAANHYVDADCEVCHIPLARTAFNAERVSSLPLPRDHRQPQFLLEVHGQAAAANPERCATCHTRERCTSCHVSVEGVAPIAAIPEAPPGFPVGPRTARYPEPPSHLRPEWLERHGDQASLRACGTCHTRNDCEACHVQPLPEAAAALPRRVGASRSRPDPDRPLFGGSRRRAQAPAPAALAATQAAAPASDAPPQDTARRAQGPGVGLVRRMPPSHAPRSFYEDHAALAAARPDNCQACHTQRFCEDCHDAPATPSFHPRNFTAQHASAAWGRRLECATCHETRTFCRACHISQGMGSNARLGPGFHDAEPVWLLRHAQAARQGLESCTSCHTQRDCLQCHSETGAFGVNPHGPNFDARRLHERNPLICLACHVTDPLAGGSQP